MYKRQTVNGHIPSGYSFPSGHTTSSFAAATVIIIRKEKFAVFTAVLRDYQKEGYVWLHTLKAYGFNGILADDMGLEMCIRDSFEYTLY